MEWPNEIPQNRQAIRKIIRYIADDLPESDVVKVETCFFVMQKTHEVFQALKSNLEQFGLSYARLGMLALLLKSGNEGASPSELAEKSRTARATVTGLLDGLEKDGLAERVRHPDDRRMIVARLTPKGKDLAIAALPSHFEQIAGLMDNLTTTEQQQLVTLIDKISTT